MLIVDNDKDMCQVISDVLKRGGYKASYIYDGAAALRRIKEERYDMVILDYKLSGISGLTVLEKARQIRPSLQVIMVSAFGDTSTRVRAKELGAYDFLDKPFNIRKLAQVVKRALNRKIVK